MTVRLSNHAVAVVQDTLEHITRNPAEHKQAYYATFDYDLTQKTGYVCGTAFCWAGHVVNRSDTLGIEWKPLRNDYDYTGGRDFRDAIVDRFTGEERTDLHGDYEAAVAEILGIPIESKDGDTWVQIVDDETRHLMYRITEGTNNLAELWHLCNELCDGRLNVPSEFQEV